MKIWERGENLPEEKMAVVLAGLDAPRITVVADTIEELQHYAVTYSAFWEMGSRRWRGGKLMGCPLGDEMDFNGLVWKNGKDKRVRVLDSQVDYRSEMYRRCLEEIMDATC